MAIPNLGEIVTTTLRNRTGEFKDNVSTNNALLNRLREKGNMRTIDGGRTIVEELDFAENSTYQRYSGFDTFDVSASDVLDAAEYDPVQSKVSIVISGREMAQNSGDSRIIDLLESRITNGQRTMANNMSTDVYSTGSLTNQVGGLQLLIADDPTTSTVVGGINQSTFSFWQNQVHDFTDNSQTAAANMLEGMNELWLDCVRGKDAPDMIVQEDTHFTIYENVLQQQQRYASSSEASAGFITLKYKSADVFHDNTESGIPASHSYFINTDFLKFVSYEGRDFDVTPDIKSFNQDASVNHVLWMGNLTSSNRARQGVLKD